MLNPGEGVWSLAKRALANSCPNDVGELVEDVIGTINAIRTSTQKLRGCILQSGLPLFCTRLLHCLCRNQGLAGGGGSDISVGADLGASE